MTKQIRPILMLLLVYIITGCAGININHSTSKYQIDKAGKYIVFPFRNPSIGNKDPEGIGSLFTNKFAVTCEQHGLNLITAFTENFRPSKDINISDAINYAKENKANYIITGHVTKWIDRATEWSGKRDFAGLEIFVRNVDSGKIVFTAELEEHSNMFWSGTPDDFVDSLSKAIAFHFLGIKKSWFD